MKIRAVFFDLGGTLFSYSGGARMGQAIVTAAQDMGINVESALIGKTWRAASERVMTAYAKQPYFLHRDLFRDTLTDFVTTLNGNLSETVVAEFIARQRAAVIDHLPIRADCHSMLQALKQRGLYLAIVSNIDDDYLDPLVEKHGLQRYLDHWTSSEAAQSCKPDVGIYHYSLNKAGLTAADALFVGDSLHHDIAGARAVGMRSVRIVEAGIATPLTSGLQVTAEPDWEIQQLTDLVPIVDDLNG